jgi:glutathione S-transferase
VPALELGDGTTMFESAAICLQLADLYPAARLIPPAGSSERALVYQWVLFAVAELEAPLFRWIRDLGEGTTDRRRVIASPQRQVRSNPRSTTATGCSAPTSPSPT